MPLTPLPQRAEHRQELRADGRVDVLVTRRVVGVATAFDQPGLMSSILITGASKGIGRATATELTKRGHRVVATARDPRSLDDLDVDHRTGPALAHHHLAPGRASVETSQSEARTALHFAELQAAVQPGGPLYMIETSASQPFAFVGGGIPVMDGTGTVVGAIDTGGASPQADHDFAVQVVALITEADRR